MVNGKIKVHAAVVLVWCARKWTTDIGLIDLVDCTAYTLYCYTIPALYARCVRRATTPCNILHANWLLFNTILSVRFSVDSLLLLNFLVEYTHTLTRRLEILTRQRWLQTHDGRFLSHFNCVALCQYDWFQFKYKKKFRFFSMFN